MSSKHLQMHKKLMLNNISQILSLKISLDFFFFYCIQRIMLSLPDYIMEYARQMMDLRYVSLAKVKFDMQLILRKRIKTDEY